MKFEKEGTKPRTQVRSALSQEGEGTQILDKARAGCDVFLGCDVLTMIFRYLNFKLYYKRAYF